MTLSTLGFILQLSAGLFAFSAVLGKDRPEQLEQKLRRVLSHLASVLWPRTVVQTIHAATRRTSARAYNSNFLKRALFGSVFPIFIVLTYLFFSHRSKIKPIVQNIAQNLGFWIVPILFISYLIAAVLSHAILDKLGMNWFPRERERLAGRGDFNYLRITLALIVCVVFLIIRCIWVLVQLTAGLTVFSSFVIVKVLSSPYLFFDNIVTRFEMRSTLALIAWTLGITGTIIRYIAN